jgi:hypothetical protein
MRVRYLSLLLGILTVMPLLADPFNYLTNGGFESGATSGVLTPVAGLSIYVFGVGGSTNIDGWTVSASSINNGSDTPLSVLVTGNPPQQPASGIYAVDFDSSWNISTGALLSGAVTGTLPEISQTFALPSGSYDLSFDASLTSEAPEPRYLLPLLSLFMTALVRSVLSRRSKQAHDIQKGATTFMDNPLIWR